MTSGSAPSLDNAGIGFLLVAAAGLSTALGAAVVYNTKLVKIASKPVLAAGLGFSGGVMLYVSFIEIFVKSLEAFGAVAKEEKDAYFLATLCLFSGMLLMRLIAILVHRLDANHHHENEEMSEGREVRSNVITSSIGQVDLQSAGHSAENGEANGEGEAPEPAAKAPADKKLMHMGLNTAAAIAIHNFPEGLATFVATLAEPTVGMTLAVAIAIHNIPEGLCVALPIYYATGKRHWAFLWGLLSGVSEPVGAFIGWLLIKSTDSDMNQEVYGTLFGLVAGMMIMIVLLELLPTGFRYDPQDRFVTNSLVVGMLVMALSLCLFKL
uniref:Zinc transporter ZupT n=1 Tax=Alexandrium monilatum TaxID=311494 RepID=A0A7S4WBC9_9DINO